MNLLTFGFLRKTIHFKVIILNKGLIKISLAAISLLLFVNVSFAQDPIFTQFYANPLYLNPAFAGADYCPRVSLNYRNQWPGISGSFITTSASYDQHIDALNGGIGLLVWDDRAGEGTLSTTNVSGIYSYEMRVTRKFTVRAGLQATWAQKSLNWSKLTFGDQIHSRRGFIFNTQEIQRDETANYVDFSAGLVGYTENVFGGISVNHLTEPNESVVKGSSPLPRKITFHGGVNIPLNARSTRGPKTYISPNLIAQLQGKATQINLGMYLSRGPLIAGLWYRYNESVIALIGFQTGIMKFGYSYDITVSKLSNTTAGSHEISLGFQFNCKPKRRSFRTISCPSF
jgi:type IX secretion system PorP/SprF family membrane protein